MRQSISQILNEAGSLKTKKEQVTFLQNRRHPGLVTFCSYANPAIKWMIPPGAPPYKESEFDDYGVLYSEARTLYVFTDKAPPGLKNIRREQLFIDLLETVDKDDAKLILDLVAGKLPGTLTYATLRKAFPELQ